MSTMNIPYVNGTTDDDLYVTFKVINMNLSIKRNDPIKFDSQN